MAGGAGLLEPKHLGQWTGRPSESCMLSPYPEHMSQVGPVNLISFSARLLDVLTREGFGGLDSLDLNGCCSDTGFRLDSLNLRGAG